MLLSPKRGVGSRPFGGVCGFEAVLTVLLPGGKVNL